MEKFKKVGMPVEFVPQGCHTVVIVVVGGESIVQGRQCRCCHDGGTVKSSSAGFGTVDDGKGREIPSKARMEKGHYRIDGGATNWATRVGLAPLLWMGFDSDNGIVSKGVFQLKIFL